MRDNAMVQKSVATADSALDAAKISRTPRNTFLRSQWDIAAVRNGPTSITVKANTVTN
ncbi:hypothetical protein D3C80_1415800 [compost metagenome]